MTLWGIDISNWQAGADLAKAKAGGCGFVFAKATEGGTYRDAHFAAFRATASRLGLPLGAYHFARPGSGRTGAQEADFFLSVVGGVRAGELPCVLDLEDTKLSATATVAWALDWLRTVEARTGVRPILYTYTSFARAHLGAGTALAAYPLWLADYRSSTTVLPPAPAPWKSWAIWQHTSTATVPGIAGRADRNITHLTQPQLKTLGGSTKEWFDMASIDDLRAAVRAELSAWQITTDDPTVTADKDGRRWVNIGSYIGRKLSRRTDTGYARDQLLAAVKAGQQAGPAADADAIVNEIADRLTPKEG